MSDPIIAHRCPWCGVAIRENAFFCPQCGKDLTPQPDFGATLVEHAPIESRPRNTADLVEPATREVSPPVVAPPSAPAQVAALSQPAAADSPAKSRPPIRQQALGKMGAGIQKAGHVARDVEGNVVERVQKIRAASNVVIDEASYDASLRFVLVAIILFVLFLVMLFLSKVIT